MKKILFVLLLTIIFSGGLLLSTHAATSEKTVSTVKLSNPIKSENIPQFVGTVIKGALGILGSVALFMFFLGGFDWLMSGGRDEQVKKGANTMLYSAVGSAIIFASYFLLSAWMTGINTK